MDPSFYIFGNVIFTFLLYIIPFRMMKLEKRILINFPLFCKLEKYGKTVKYYFHVSMLDDLPWIASQSPLVLEKLCFRA